MRVVGGLYRSRVLRAPRGTSTRPTSDRLRETLFNILALRVEGSRFLDLYAGTGAVGIEALSRGAQMVLFAENAPAALVALRANLADLRISGGFAIDDQGTAVLLEKLAKSAKVFDITYLDPPYESEHAYRSTLNLLGSARGSKLLSAESLVIAEHSSRNELPEHFGVLSRIRFLKQGDAALSFYEARQAVSPT